MMSQMLTNVYCVLISIKSHKKSISEKQINVPLTRFKVSLKQYLSSNILTISYPK